MILGISFQGIKTIWIEHSFVVLWNKKETVLVVTKYFFKYMYIANMYLWIFFADESFYADRRLYFMWKKYSSH